MHAERRPDPNRRPPGLLARPGRLPLLLWATSALLASPAAAQQPKILDPFDGEGLLFLLHRCVADDFLGQCRGQHDRALGVTDDHISRHHEHARARDGHVDFQRQVHTLQRGGVGRAVIHG